VCVCVCRCRSIYYDKRDKAYSRPDLMLCIIADIMDQSKTTIPHFRRKKKKWSSLHGLRQCVMGVKVHGQRMDHYVTHARVGTGGGSNFTVECISRTLRKVAAMDGRNGRLPPHLYMQMDNCSGDNKNFAIVGYLNYLVAQGVFSTVEVGFLPVGHTHEDIDQGFSVLSRHLRRVDALSPMSYRREVLRAFSQPLDRPDIEYVNVKRDFKTWIEQEGVLYKKRSGITGIKYLRVTSYGRAKTFMKGALEKQSIAEQQTKIGELQAKLRQVRGTLIDKPKDPPIEYEGTEEQYAGELMALQESMDTVAAELEEAKQPIELTVPVNERLREELGGDDTAVVIHYKINMDDAQYLPLYPEGVRWYLREPEGEPGFCPHLPEWTTRPGPNIKSPLEEFRGNLVSMMEDVNLFTDEEKADWREWMEEQDRPSEYYHAESEWGFPTCVPIEELEFSVNPAPQVTTRK